MTTRPSRRDFLWSAAAVGALPVLSACGGPGPAGVSQAPRFRISLAQWSLHRTIRRGDLDHLDFARVARQDYGLEAIEDVNQFFMDRATDTAYLAEMNARADAEGVYQHLIMCDGEGQLGHPEDAQRTQAVDNHRKWVDAAVTLGCATIRVNAASTGSFEEQQKLAADGLRRLSEIGDAAGINVIVENHGGLSSNGEWLAGVMRMVDHPRCGTLPDFGNFYDYDAYQGVEDMMPFAKAVSAKSHDFDEAGNETEKDYRRFMQIVLDAGFDSWVGIEYEGSTLPEDDGIRRTKALLERVRTELG